MRYSTLTPHVFLFLIFISGCGGSENTDKIPNLPQSNTTTEPKAILTFFNNSTNLLWQIKDDGQKRRYSEAKSYCDDLVIGSYSNWRLPSVQDLKSILNYTSSNPATNKKIFLNTKSFAYWTETTTYGYKGHKWEVDFAYGNIFSEYTSNQLFVRCVSGNYITQSLVDNKDGTVTSKKLMWQQKFDNTKMNWYQASGTANPVFNPDGVSVCQKLNLANHNDWRLPSIPELSSITDYNAEQPALNTVLFPNTPPFSQFWSATVPDVSNAWYVSNMDGKVQFRKRSDSTLLVRCVRDIY